METPPFGEGQLLVFISSNARLFASTSFFLLNFPNHYLRHSLCGFFLLQNSLSCNEISLVLASPTTKMDRIKEVS